MEELACILFPILILAALLGVVLAIVALMAAGRAERRIKELERRLDRQADARLEGRPPAPEAPAGAPRPAAAGPPKPAAAAAPPAAGAARDAPTGEAVPAAGPQPEFVVTPGAGAGPPARPTAEGSPPLPGAVADALTAASHGAPPLPRPQAAAAAGESRPPIRWEEWIGLKGLAWVGMIVLLIGAALLAKYLHLGPWGRIIVETVGGLAAMAAGEVFARKAYRVLARVSTGGGLALLYFAVFSGRVLEDVIPEPATWILMTAITAVAIILAVRYASLSIAILSLVGGLSAPLLIHPARDPGHVLFLYLVAVNAGILVLAYFKKWRLLNLLALVGTMANVTFWLFSHYWHGETATEKLAFIVTYMTVLWAMYFALSIVYHLLGARAPSRLDLPVTLVNIVAYFGGLYALLQEDHHWTLGPAAAALAAVYLAEGLAVRRWAARHMPFILLQLAQAIGLATLAIPIQLEGIYIPMAWAVEAAVLFYLGVRLADWRVRAAGLLVHVLSIVAIMYFGHEMWQTAGPVIANTRTATFAVVALAMALSAYLYRRVQRQPQGEAVVLTFVAAAAHAVLVVMIAVETYWWADQVRTALTQQHLHPVEIHEQMQRFLWLRDTFTAIGLAAYGLAAVGLVAVLRRAVHQVMALAVFVTALVFLGISLAEAPPPTFLVGLNGVGAAFAAVAACLAGAAIVSRYATPAALRPRAFAITYELLAVAAVLALYLTEVARAVRYANLELDLYLSETSAYALMAAGLAAFAAGLMLRGFWIRSAAHRAAGLTALAVALLLLIPVTLPARQAYKTLLWNPRGVAFLLTVAAMALAVVGYLRTLPRASKERRIVAAVLAVLVHPVALALFTLEAMDFWDAHAAIWIPREKLHAWYARHATLSVGYALYALALLGAGIAKRSRLARITALVILGVTLAKVMLLDLSRVGAIWRILSFIGLGLLLLAASLLYHRYRHLLFPAEPPEAKKEANHATE